MTKQDEPGIPPASDNPDPGQPPIPASNGPDRATMVATLVTMPCRQAALALGTIEGLEDASTIRALVLKLTEQSQRAQRGDLGLADEMLVAQAHTLDAIFSDCVRRAVINMGEHIGAAETFMRLALKAQAQCRATLETLANIKSPPTVFTRQANIAHGPQQVNNGMLAPGPRAGKCEDQQNELSGGGNDLHPDIRPSQAASRIDSPVEAVGEVNRAQVGGR